MYVLIVQLRRAYSFFGIQHHHSIIRRLRLLNERIRAEVTLEKGFDPGKPSGFLRSLGFTRRSRQQIPIAQVREIEAELIDILGDIGRVPKLFSRAEFVFIFDELDKIQRKHNISIDDKEEAELLNTVPGENQDSALKTRQRREAIAAILANMKRFFSVAEAKFFFIAGREMYDTAFADVSDREAFISSIFHEIIYVESFFKDPMSRSSKNILGLTEQYLCSMLLPSDSYYERSLRGYEQYLKEEYLPDKVDTRLFETIEKYQNYLKICESNLEAFKARFPTEGDSLDKCMKNCRELSETLTDRKALFEVSNELVQNLLTSAISTLETLPKEIKRYEVHTNEIKINEVKISQLEKILKLLQDLIIKIGHDEKISFWAGVDIDNFCQNAAQRKKVIIFLNQYVTFLAYRSNGAPKKMAKLVEELIYPLLV